MKLEAKKENKSLTRWRKGEEPYKDPGKQREEERMVNYVNESV